MPDRAETVPIAAVAVALACALGAGCAPSSSLRSQSAAQPAAAVPPVVAAPPVEVVAPPPAVDPLAAAVVRLSAFQERLAGLPNGALADEVARLRNAPRTPEATLELAMALARTRDGGDAARALQMLEPLVHSSDPADEPWRTLARLFATGLGEQRRLEEQVERQAQQLRESQKRVDQANEKLEALRAIERSLGSRPAPAAAPRDSP